MRPRLLNKIIYCGTVGDKNLNTMSEEGLESIDADALGSHNPIRPRERPNEENTTDERVHA
jgi:hypothetical protein